MAKVKCKILYYKLQKGTSHFEQSNDNMIYLVASLHWKGVGIFFTRTTAI
jgi:hypothetical protein